MKKLNKGLFIALEGGEGCGKTTMAKKLEKYLSDQGYDVIYSREPGSSKAGEEIRHAMLYYDNDPITDLFLASAARRLNCVENILPALKENKIVICDRFTDSTLVYQGWVNNIPSNIIHSCNDIATGKKYPDVTIILDINPELGLERAAQDGHERNKNDVKDIKFYRNVCVGYRTLSHIVGVDGDDSNFSHPRYLIDGSRAVNSVFTDIVTIVERHIKKREAE